MSIFPLRRKRHGHAGRFYAPPAADAPTQAMPSCTPPRREYDPAIRAQAAAIVAQAEAEAAAAREAAVTQAWGAWDRPAAPQPQPAPLVPVAHEPPPMPPSGLSRIMVSQIPAPPPGDLSYDQSHRYAEYLRKIGAATGTSSSLEDTGMWALPALEPGDGTGVAL